MAKGIIEGIKNSGQSPEQVLSVFRIPGSWEQEAVDLLKAEGVEALGRETSLDESAKIAVERMES